METEKPQQLMLYEEPQGPIVEVDSLVQEQLEKQSLTFDGNVDESSEKISETVPFNLKNYRVTYALNPETKELDIKQTLIEGIPMILLQYYPTETMREVNRRRFGPPPLSVETVMNDLKSKYPHINLQKHPRINEIILDYIHQYFAAWKQQQIAKNLQTNDQ